ncbi:hypothetical protein SISSUDRAFT_1071465 [Sistotremastrum suecicum HHB10207 ss-3]|uniref:Zn(2)-C6 fungal-type domain-containing protein n=1 Tax=Sistotremastrum suecicum HHB10207 ss-3 TaxID=1314776 RepID=A0A166BQP3_9AGAM|nr:hypothetical protein SISSUDRAFT_1071465 [Sistotremastrum suecicum HHB10207 ss-3]
MDRSASASTHASNSAVANSTVDQESDDDETQDLEGQPAGPPRKSKIKLTRGSRACTVCRKLKLRCVGGEQGGSCKKCLSTNQECIFPESNRGKSSKKTQEELARSVRKMERSLETVIKSINNPLLNSMSSGMASLPSSPPSIPPDAIQTYGTPPVPLAEPRLPSYEDTSPRLPSLPLDTLNPLGLLAEASLANEKALEDVQSKDHGSTADSSSAMSDPSRKIGIANERYFKPGPMTLLPMRRRFIEQQVQPEMLSFVSTNEVLELFKLFFEHINHHCCLLVPEYHTPSFVCSRSPFLLTTICAIASKYSPTTAIHHERLTNLAKHLAFDVPQKGYKSLEIVQAYLLLTLWGYGHADMYEHDTTWLLLGMAIRTATDLNLHRKLPETSGTREGIQSAVELHNRERTWILCFVLDRSISAQLGKPHTIQEDYIIRNVSTWWRKPVAVPLDSGLAAYAELQMIIARSLELLYSGTDTPSGLQADCNYLLVTKSLESQLMVLRDQWALHTSHRNKSKAPDDQPIDDVKTFWNVIARFYYHYTLLLLYSFGLQDAVERTPINLGHFYSKCHSAAKACVLVVRDELGPLGFLRYSPDSHFVQCSYAVLTLLKLLRPEFNNFHDGDTETLQLVRDIAVLLEQIAVGSYHTPALYSSFLKGLIATREAQMSQAHDGPQYLSSHAMDEVQGNNLTASSVPVDSVLSGGFWDSMLIPGYNTPESLSGGYVYGADGGSFIPQLGDGMQYGKGMH